ncbi:MAG: sodium:solute symporter [Candidatus Zixiibacteriota bacterium]
MTHLDWAILVAYLLGIVALAIVVGRKQKSQEDYYLGGRRMPAWQVALSVMATQVSAISLIGAPAFIALKPGGGLVWLQYEFAVPLAMILIILILVPVYHRMKSITIYEYLENRYGVATRSMISLVFLISRGLGTGVALLATGIVTSACLGLPLTPTIILIGIVSMLYTTIGGIKADIYSDIIQLVILWLGTFVCIYIVWNLLGDSAFTFAADSQPRLITIDFASTGFGDGKTFAFWPMLIGGLFLYFSYYGCDQSESQRILTTSDARSAQKALLMNGLLRFVLVLTYCFFGVLLLSFLEKNPTFAATLQGVQPDFLVPSFLIEYVPKGLLGLVVAGIFAASMSSVDSAMNALSAATWRDFLARQFPKMAAFPQERTVRISRLLTIIWGLIATAFALYLSGGMETVIVLVNKIGSAFYGPVLAVFLLGIMTRYANQTGAIVGLLSGVTVNLILWQGFQHTVSWLWWNPIGVFVSITVGYIISIVTKRRRSVAISENIPLLFADLSSGRATPLRYSAILFIAFMIMVATTYLIGYKLTQ